MVMEREARTTYPIMVAATQSGVTRLASAERRDAERSAIVSGSAADRALVLEHSAAAASMQV